MDKSAPSSPRRSSSALLFCRMCQAVYREPKLLPCLHSFCRPCLADTVISEAEGNVVVCPLCSHKTKIPPDGVVDFPDNCFLSRMSQEYISEVQNNIVARSLHPMTSRRSSEFTELRSQPKEELSHGKSSPPPGYLSQHAPQHTPEDPQHASRKDFGPASRQSAANALESIHNMSRLQTKIMSLQGEALRVTYAIDHVNQCMIEWQQHKDDVKRSVQRRSAQFQFFIKRMEHQLISQIEGKHADDEFYAESDKSKTELRKVLKKILHEVNVLKTFQELGNDAEVGTLSYDLLGKSVGMTDVFMNKLHFNIDVPTQSIEEIAADWFGVVRISSVAANIFAPEVLDFTEIPMGNLDEQNGHEFSPYEEDREAYVPCDEEMSSSGEQMGSSRSFSDSSAVRYNDEDLDKEDVREHLVQFQNVRETLRTRRREILVRGQQAREGVSSLREESHRRTRAMRRDRVQSLDRIAAPVTKKRNKAGLSGKSNLDERSTECETRPHNERASITHPALVFNLQHVSGANHFFHRSIPEDMHVPSPVLEEVSLLHAPQRILVKQTSDPRSVISTLREMSNSETTLPSHSQSATEHLSVNASAAGGADLFRGRRHSSDHFGCVSPGKGPHLDVTHDKNATRLVRRAISGVADRKTKIDYLRENWQKRKEILIQNEGFVSPDSMAKHATRSSVHPWSPTMSSSHASFDTSQLEDHRAISSEEHNDAMTEEGSYDNNDTTKGDERCNEGVESSPPSLRKQTCDSPTPRHPSSGKLEATPEIPTSSNYSLSPQQSTIKAQYDRTTPQSSMGPTLASTPTSSTTIQQLHSSLAQEGAVADTASTHATPTTSRYSRFHTKPTESIDVTSLIAAMYSGKLNPNRNTTPNKSSESTTTTQSNTDTLNNDKTVSSSNEAAGTDNPATSHKLTPKTSPSLKHETGLTSPTPNGAAMQPDSLDSQSLLHYPYIGTPRYNEGINRRHTIEVGQATSMRRSTDHWRNQRSSEDEDTTMLPLAESKDEDRLKYAYMRFKTREDATKRVPSPIQFMYEQTSSDQSATSDSPSVLASSATSLSSPQPPSSPTPSDGVQKVKLRELARKKKERWRHLTIH